jgi:hypothetical protein
MVFIVMTSLTAFAETSAWDKCKGCHNGNLAPDAKEFRERFKKVDELVKAATESDNPFMKNVKENEKLLREAAKDLGLK